MTLTDCQNLLEPIAERARRAPDVRVLTVLHEDGTDEHVSAGDVLAEAQAYASGFERAGIAPDDVVILAIGPLRPLIATFLGAMWRGAIPSISSWGTDRLDAAVHRQGVTTLAQSCGARAVVTTADRGAVLRDMLADSGCRVLGCEDLPLAGAPPSDAAVRRAPEDIAFLQYSSGSAGRPKGVPNTHGATLRYLDAKRRTSVGPRDVVVSWLPLYHDFGLVSGLLCPLVLGVHGVLMAAHHWVRDPKMLFRAIHQYRGTVCFMPNFAFNHCVRTIRDRDLEGMDLSHWEKLLSGSEPVRLDSFRGFAERFAPYGFRASALRTGYGMAELVEGVTTSAIGDPPGPDWIDRTRLQAERRAEPAVPHQPGGVAIMSCGRPMPGTELRIADERGNALPERAVGEVMVRSAYMFRGYYRQPELTAQAIRDGWFCSGDLGYLADGQLYITGRKKDLIIVGGRNVHPEDLEQIADKTPGLRPGRSVAFGIPDALLGSERIVVVCEVAADCDAEQQLAIERQLRRNVTREIGVTLGEVRFVPRGWISKTSSGKTARPVNRRRFLEQYGRAHAGDANRAPTPPQS
ncbi:MAG: AMP-binding protein [Candidatus Binatia bacterium]